MPALAFMFASTNLVFELGIVLWLLMGWRFVLAEFVVAFVLTGLDIVALAGAGALAYAHSRGRMAMPRP